MTEAAGTVHAGSAETKANDVHATGDAMGVVAQAFPLLCPLCGGQMRIIAFITHSADIRRILEHITGAYRGRDKAAAHHPGTRAAALG